MGCLEFPSGAVIIQHDRSTNNHTDFIHIYLFISLPNLITNKAIHGLLSRVEYKVEQAASSNEINLYLNVSWSL